VQEHKVINYGVKKLESFGENIFGLQEDNELRKTEDNADFI